MLPDLKMPLVRSGQQTAFAGLNHTNGAGNGEIYDMTNLCSDEYPLLSSRRKRHSVTNQPGAPHKWKKYTVSEQFSWDVYEQATVYKSTVAFDFDLDSSNTREMLFSVGVKKLNGSFYPVGSTLSWSGRIVSGTAQRLREYVQNGYRFAYHPYFSELYCDLEMVDFYQTSQTSVRMQAYRLSTASEGSPTIVAGALKDERLYSSDSSAYPNGGAYNDVYTIKRSGKERYKDEYVGNVFSPNADAYPQNGEKDGFWYVYDGMEQPHGIYAAGSLFTVYGTKLYVDGAEKGTVTDTDKVFCALGERVVIFPDKVIYANGALAPLESRWAGVSLTFKDGTYAGEDAQANTIYASGVDWEDYFKVGDAVTISGCTTHTENNRTSIIREIDGANLRFYENTFTLGEGETSYTETGTDTDPLKIERTVPDLDFLCSNENRIWGCKDDTICCCKLGDPFNWNVFDGLSTDAWSVDGVNPGAKSGKAGKFTGCVSYLGYPVFFKEDQIFKVYGSVPTNFQLMASATFGVMEGCAKSLAIAGEVLYYLSRVGVVQYSGGIPSIISEPLGTRHFYAGCAGSDWLKYYISLQDENGAYGLYVYDTQRRLWHKEDATQIVGAAYQNGLYAQTANGDILLLGDPPVVPDGASEEQSVSSEAIFADFDFGTFDAKRVIRLNARIEVEAGATVTAYISYDGEAWEAAGTVTATQKTVQELMLPIERGDHFRMKFNATGAWKLWALRYEYHDGGRK